VTYAEGVEVSAGAGSGPPAEYDRLEGTVELSGPPPSDAGLCVYDCVGCAGRVRPGDGAEDGDGGQQAAGGTGTGTGTGTGPDANANTDADADAGEGGQAPPPDPAGPVGGGSGCPVSAGYVLCPATGSCIRPSDATCPVPGGIEFAGPTRIRCSSGRCALEGEEKGGGCGWGGGELSGGRGGYYVADLDGSYEVGEGCVATCEGCRSGGGGLPPSWASSLPPTAGPTLEATGEITYVPTSEGGRPTFSPTLERLEEELLGLDGEGPTGDPTTYTDTGAEVSGGRAFPGGGPSGAFSIAVAATAATGWLA
jgi:hypothetical protein